MASDVTQGGAPAGGDPHGGTAAQPSPVAIDSVVALTPLMARLDVAVAAIFAVIGATLTVAMPALIDTGGIETERDFTTLSPAHIPRMAFGALTVLAIIAIIPAVETVRSGIGRRRADEWSRLRRAGVATLIAVAYAASVTILGYIPATMLMTAVMAWYLGLRNPLAFVPGVLVIPVAIKFVFERLLLISLPRSEIESIGLVEDAVLRFLSKLLIA